MLLAWNTSSHPNWGARGAHVATHRLLQKTGADLERLPRKYQTLGRPIGFPGPRQVWEALWWRREKPWIAQAYDTLESWFGGRDDFIDPRPEVSRKNILRNLESDYIRALHDAVKRHDVIVVDGNGDMIFKDEPTRNLLVNLALVELGDYFGKEVYYINSIFADCPITGRNQTLATRCINALKKCSAVSFRDPRSLELARDMEENLDAEWIPDSMFYWYDHLSHSESQVPGDGDFIIPYTREDAKYLGDLNFEVPYVCVTGGSRAAFTPEKAVDGYCDLVKQLARLEPAVYLVPTGAGDNFLYEVAEETQTPIVPTETPVLMGGAVLANARLVVTGRYHPSIMAAAGGTPCVFLGADSHKTSSLQRLLGYDEVRTFSAIPGADEREAVVARGRALIDEGRSLRDRIQQAAQRRAEEVTQVVSLVTERER